MTYHLTRKSAYVDANIVLDAAWPTRLGRPVLANAEVKTLVETKLRHVAKSYGSVILHLDVADDHVRMRISVPPQIAPLALLTHLKTESARAINVAFPEIKRKVSGIWNWHTFLRSLGNTHAGAVDDYLLKTKGLSRAAS